MSQARADNVISQWYSFDFEEINDVTLRGNNGWSQSLNVAKLSEPRSPFRLCFVPRAR